MTESEFVELLHEETDLYRDGEEMTENGILASSKAQLSENQITLAEKLQHLREDGSRAETIRKATHVGLMVLSAEYVDEETAQTLLEEMEDELEQNGDE